MRFEWLEATAALNAAVEASDEDTIRWANQVRDNIKNDFARANRGLAMAGAQEFLTRAKGEDRVDIESAAMLGLWEAFAGTDPARVDQVTVADDGTVSPVVGWDPSQSTFGNYSRRYIRGAVMRCVARNESGLSYALWTHRPHVLAAQAELAEKLGRAPSVAEVAAKVKLPLDTVRAVLTPNRVSLQTQLGDGFTLEDTLADTAASEAPTCDVDSELLAALLLASADRIKPVDLFSLLLRNGLVGREPMTVVEAAARLGVGRGTVSAGVARAWPRLVDTAHLWASALAFIGLTRTAPETASLIVRTARAGDVKPPKRNKRVPVPA